MTRDDYHGTDAGDVVRFLTAGFGMGLLVGAAIGVLLAPKSGAETREQLKDFASEVGTRAKDAASNIGERTAATYSQVSDSTRTAYGEVGDRARQMGTRIEETASNVRDVTGKVTHAAKEGYKKTMDELKPEADAESAAEE